MRWTQKASTLLSAWLACSCMLFAQNAGSTVVQQHIRQAELDLRAHDLAGAEQEYRQILSLNPQNSEAWTGLGVLLYGSGKSEPASGALQQALQIDPLSPRAELFLALSRADQGKCGGASPTLAKYFASQPVGNLQLVTGLALLQCSANPTDAVQAVQTATRLRQLYPEDPDVLYESAELFTRLWDQAAGELISKHPESYRVHQLAGEIDEAQNNYDQAIREYSLALQENPKLPQMHYRIGQLYLRKADADADEKAVDQFQKELQINPQSAVSDLAMADLAMHQHNLDDAKPLYEQAAKLDPTLVTAKIGLARILLEQHQTGAAIQQLQVIAAQNPANAAAHYNLMLAYRQDKQMNKASAEMEAFHQLQTRRSDSFQDKLNALLTGKSSSPEPLGK